MVTVPRAPAAGSIRVTTTWNVTACPTLPGLGEGPIDVVVAPILTTWLSGDASDGSNVASPS